MSFISAKYSESFDYLRSFVSPDLFPDFDIFKYCETLGLLSALEILLFLNFGVF